MSSDHTGALRLYESLHTRHGEAPVYPTTLASVQALMTYRTVTQGTGTTSLAGFMSHFEMACVACKVHGLDTKEEAAVGKAVEALCKLLPRKALVGKGVTGTLALAAALQLGTPAMAAGRLELALLVLPLGLQARGVEVTRATSASSRTCSWAMWCAPRPTRWASSPRLAAWVTRGATGRACAPCVSGRCGSQS